MEPIYRGHIGTLETVLYIEVVDNSTVLIRNRTSVLCILIQSVLYQRFHCYIPDQN